MLKQGRCGPVSLLYLKASLQHFWTCCGSFMVEAHKAGIAVLEKSLWALRMPLRHHLKIILPYLFDLSHEIFTAIGVVIIKQRFSDPTSTFIKRQCYFITFDRPWKCIADAIYLNKISFLYLRFYLLGTSLPEELLLTLYCILPESVHYRHELQFLMH